MNGRLCIAVLAAALGSVAPALAQAGCAEWHAFELGLEELMPVGQTTLYASTLSGYVLESYLELVMVAPPGTDGGDWAFSFFGPLQTDQGWGAFAVSGHQLRWFGPGEFEALVPLPQFNGVIVTTGLSLWESQIIPVNDFFAGQSFTTSVLWLNVSAAIPGDLDGDGFVGQTDLGLLLAAFGTGAGGDLNCDGVTNQVDLGILLANFGKCAPLIC